MYVNKLMIGDWVLQSHSNVFLKVDNITPPYISAYKQDGQFHGNSLSPIPLTIYCISKNGWKEVSVDDDCGYRLFALNDLDEDIYCGIRFYDCGLIRLYIGNDIKHLEMKKPINYIHDLQHALHICEIEKEIVL